VERVRAIVNTAYLTSEAGLWKPEWERTSAAWLRDDIARGELAVARREGEPVGCVRVIRRDETTGELGLLAAAPEAHGTGVGTALVRFAEDASRAGGATEMRLELLVPRHGTQPAKERLHEWYTRLGYRVTGRTDFVAAYPEIRDLVAVPCDLRRYRKALAT